MAQHTEEIKHIADGLSIMTVIGTLADVLPAIAALFTIIWTGFRIWETETVKGWLKRK
jgi:hypothetical protein